MISLLTVLLNLLLPAPSSGAVVDIERDVVAYRRAIHQMDVTWDETTTFYKDGKATEVMPRISHIWLDEQRLRLDVTLKYPGDSQMQREVVCRNCEADDLSMHFYKPGVALQFRPLAKSNEPFLVDPRLMGLAPCSSPNLSKWHFESFLGRQDRSDVTSEEGTLNSRPCRIIKYRTLDGVNIRAWIVPEWGPSVAKWEQDSRFPEQHVFSVVECSYRRDSSSQIWYPETYAYRRMFNDKLQEEEHTKITVHSINTPIPSETFRLIGMDIPPGTLVTGPPDTSLSGDWNGKSIVQGARVGSVNSLSQEELQRSRASRRTLFFVNAIVLSVIAGFFLWRYVKGRAR
jgi:hypothetical protein